MCSCSRSYQRRSTCARSFAVFARQAGWAASAASIARRVSAAPQRGSSASSSPVAGFSTSNVSPESASTQSPSM